MSVSKPEQARTVTRFVLLLAVITAALCLAFAPAAHAETGAPATEGGIQQDAEPAADSAPAANGPAGESASVTDAETAPADDPASTTPAPSAPTGESIIDSVDTPSAPEPATPEPAVEEPTTPAPVESDPEPASPDPEPVAPATPTTPETDTSLPKPSDETAAATPLPADTAADPSAPETASKPEPAATAAAHSPVPAKAASPAAPARKAAASTGKGDLAAGIYFIVSKLSSQRLVGVSGKSKSKGANVNLGALFGGKYQQWKLVIGKDGYATIVNVNSGKLLSVVGSKRANGTNILQWAAKHSKNLNQKWVVKKVGGYYRIVSGLNTTKVLNIEGGKKAAGTNICLWTWNKGNGQLFKFVPMNSGTHAKPGTRVVKDGLYTIHSLGAGKRSLDVEKRSIYGGAQVQTVAAGLPAGQTFNIVYDGKGYYRITNVRSGKKLAVPAAAKLPGMPVGQYALDNGSDLAKWRIEKSGSGYRFVNKASGLALEIPGTSKGANNARAWTAKQTDAQRFRLSRKAAFGPGVFAIEVVGSKNLAFTVNGNKAKPGTGIGTATYGKKMSQRYLVAKYASGYTIRPFNSRLYLTATLGNKLVQAKLAKGHVGQIWDVQVKDGRIVLVNKYYKRAATISGSASKAATSIKTAKATGSNKQLLYLRAVNPVESGVYYIEMGHTAGKVLNVDKGKRTSNTNANIWSKGSQNSQRFAVLAVGDGTYTITNVASGRVVDVKNGSGANGANVVMYKPTGAKHQRWKISVNDDFTLKIANAQTGTCLTVMGGKTANGTNVKAYKAKDGAASQGFWLRPSSKQVEVVQIGVPCYMQNPQLPTGCESVALTNALRYWGFNLGKTTIANHWMPYGGNGVYNFIGNPYNESGWIICAPGIMNTANKFLKSKGSSIRAKNVTGTNLANLRQYLDKGQPVIVWTTIGMGRPGSVQAWRSGYPLRSNNHAVVLTGYNPKNGKYQVADSLAGTVWRNGSSFNSLYNLMGKQAVVLYD